MRLRFSLLLFLLSGLCSAKPTRFEVKDVAFRNVVQWISDATLEKIIGTSHFIVGWVELDPQNLKSGVKGEFEVDVRSFETGPDSRQAKLRDTLLAAQDYPGASFNIEKLVDASSNELGPGKTVTGRLIGVLSARGVSRRQTMQIKASYFPESERTKRRLTGNLLKASAYFDLPLSELKFTVPEPLEGLLASLLKVSADVVGTDQLPASPP